MFYVAGFRPAGENQQRRVARLSGLGMDCQRFMMFDN
jgi:hypothetical protein